MPFNHVTFQREMLFVWITFSAKNIRFYLRKKQFLKSSHESIKNHRYFDCLNQRKSNICTAFHCLMLFIPQNQILFFINTDLCILCCVLNNFFHISLRHGNASCRISSSTTHAMQKNPRAFQISTFFVVIQCQ